MGNLGREGIGEVIKICDKKLWRDKLKEKTSYKVYRR